MPDRPGAAARLAILSYSFGEYDARSFRVARSALAAGYQVVIYTRWSFGQPLGEDREGYRLVRVPHNWQLGVPGLRGWARRRLAAEVAESERALAAAGAGEASHLDASASEASASEAPDVMNEPSPGTARPGLPRRLARRLARPAKRWFRLVAMFPLRPLGWAEALEPVVAPADIWHGMWAGSLPALARLRAAHGGHTIYDSRDVYMLSRDFASLEWPLRPILASLERRWARDTDRVLTVNDAYADLLERQLRVARPPVVLNCPERWYPPSPPPDLLRAALDLPPSTPVVLYQGQLIGGRGIEQAMKAIVDVPGAVLCLLGYGMEARYRRLAAEPAYAGRVHVLPPVKPEVLLAWTASADVMVMPIQPTTTNHRFTTPQKLWEAIAAGVPTVASDLPGMAPVVKTHDVGIVCDPTSPSAIAAAIRRILDAPLADRMAMRDHVLAVAHEHYNWEAQLRTLFGVYDQLTGRHTADGTA